MVQISRHWPRSSSSESELTEHPDHTSILCHETFDQDVQCLLQQIPASIAVTMTSHISRHNHVWESPFWCVEDDFYTILRLIDRSIAHTLFMVIDLQGFTRVLLWYWMRLLQLADWESTLKPLNQNTHICLLTLLGPKARAVCAVWCRLPTNPC